jgi:hypothetical protein
MLRGNLKVTMEFKIPVSEDLYPTIQRQNALRGVESHAQQILDAEEQNYIANPDGYLERLLDHVTEVSFDFEPSKERWDDCSSSSGE